MGSLLLITILLPLAGALVILLLGSQRAALVRWAALATTLATLVLTIVIVLSFTPRPDPTGGASAAISGEGPIRPDPNTELRIPWMDFGTTSPGTEMAGGPRIEFHLGLDGISLWLFALTAFLLVPSVLVSWESITDRPAEFFALLLALETGMLGVFCAFDIILFYIFFEFTLLPLFFLIGIWGGPEKRHAARKFFIYTLAGSLISLIGLVSLILALHSIDNSTITFSIPELARNLAQRPLDLSTQRWVFLALFVGFAIKVPLVPFHTWLPLAHTEAPTAGSVLLAGVLLKLGTYGFLRLCLPLLPGACVTLGVPLIATLASIGVVYGALCALVQDDIKKLVAYSSVSHLGFCMLGMFALNQQGIDGSILQMINHGLSTGGLFLLVGMLYERYHTRRLSDFGGLAAKLPYLAIFMVFMCLSSMALPGLNGFVGETLCLIGMFRAHWGYAVVGAIGIILGAWYLLSMIQRVFFGPLQEPHHGDLPVADLKPREWAALVPIALLCLVLGVYPALVLASIRPEVQAIVQLYQK
jgi:NADH-quinone oxidoreductase subunit M